MIKENLSHNRDEKESSFGFKTQLAALFTVLSMQYGIAQTNIVNSDTTIKAKTEVVTTTNEILSPEKILEKHKITDINTATIEQLQAVVDEVTALLKKKILTGENEMSYITFRREIREQIIYKK